jgi:hypothetical protein
MTEKLVELFEEKAEPEESTKRPARRARVH